MRRRDTRSGRPIDRSWMDATPYMRQGSAGAIGRAWPGRPRLSRLSGLIFRCRRNSRRRLSSCGRRQRYASQSPKARSRALAWFAPNCTGRSKLHELYCCQERRSERLTRFAGPNEGAIFAASALELCRRRSQRSTAAVRTGRDSPRRVRTRTRRQLIPVGLRTSSRELSMPRTRPPVGNLSPKYEQRRSCDADGISPMAPTVRGPGSWRKSIGNYASADRGYRDPPPRSAGM